MASPTEIQCGFVEGRQQVPDITSQLLEKLKNASLPVTAARAEAYGENCISASGTLVRFAARETDFYVTLSVMEIQDETTLGTLLGKVLSVIDQFPNDQTPGPNPGYIGITFESGTSTLNLWFKQTRSDELRTRGIQGVELFRALKDNP